MNKENDLKDENFIQLSGWMRTKYDLKGNELLIYGLIFGFTQKDGIVFDGSIGYISKWCGCSSSTVKTTLKSLLSKGLLKKKSWTKNMLTFNEYHHLTPPVRKPIKPQSENLSNPSQKLTRTQSETDPNNNTYNIKDNIKDNNNTPVGGKSKDFHAPFIKIYFDWFLEKFKSKPKITVADTAASKQLINYFLNNEQDPLESLGAIFSHWHRLDDFTQKNVDLRKLNSNINSIIQQLTKKHGKQDKFDESIKRNFSDQRANEEWLNSEWKSSLDRRG